MGRKKMPVKEKKVFQNVGLLAEDHAKLKEVCEVEMRSMSQQLSMMIRKTYDQLYWVQENEKVD